MKQSLPLNRIVTVLTLIFTVLTISQCNRFNPEDSTLSKEQLLDAMKEWYLWSDTIPDVNPDDYDSPSQLLEAIRLDIDRWSKIVATDYNDSLLTTSIQSHGFVWAWDSQDKLRVGYTYESTEAANAGVERGWVITHINGQTVTRNNLDELVGDSIDVVNTFSFQTPSGGSQQLSLVNRIISPLALQHTDTFMVAGKQVGYLVLDNFLVRADSELKNLFKEINDHGELDELIVDVRYTQYGLTQICRYLANIIAGNNADKGPFVRYEFNSIKAKDRNLTYRFEPVADSLNIDKVYIITSHVTSGLGEVLIRGLRPYMEVYQIGTTTDGKPVSIIGRQFPDSTLLPVTYKMTNRNFDPDFFDGLTPDIEVADDFSRALGDKEEACLKKALEHIENYIDNPRK